MPDFGSTTLAKQIGGFAAGGTSTQSGNGSTTVFNIAHGLAQTPDIVNAYASSADANSSDFQIDKDSTNITVTYNMAPPTGTNNLIWEWGAAYINPLASGFSSPLSSSIYTIHIAGTTVKARNNITGVTDYTADNTVDAVTAINSAINNIQNITNVGLDSTYAGSISLADGKYKCITTLTNAFSTAARRGIRIKGSGPGTILDFTPGSALTNAILFDNTAESGIEHLRIQANSNVTNFIKITGTDATNQWMASRGRIEDIIFEGANFRTTISPTAGTVGILNDGVSVGTPYYWIIENCRFLSIETGIKATGIYSTSMFIEHVGLIWCDVGVDIASNTSFVNDVWHQGGTSPAVGTAAVRLRGTAVGNMISKVVAELDRGDVTCQGVLLDSGANANFISDVINPFADNVTKFTVKDNSGNATNLIQYMDYGTGSMYLNELVLAGLTTSLRSNLVGTQTFEFGSNNATGGVANFDFHTDSGDGDYRTRFQRGSGANGIFAFFQTGTGGWYFNVGPIFLEDGINLSVGSTAGTKIGSSTTEKIGFYNKTPVVQPTAISSPTADVTSLKTAVDAIRTRLTSLGLTA